MSRFYVPGYRFRRGPALFAILAASGIGSLAQAATLTWDALSATGGPQDGSGTWSTSNNTWWDGSSSVNWSNSPVNDASIGAGGIAGTVTVSGTVNVGNITFGTAIGNYLLTSGTINLAAASGTSTITVANAATINSMLTGTARLVKVGSQMLTLGGSNSYTGGTELAGGILRITSTNALGSITAPVILSSGTLELNSTGGTTVELGSLSGAAGTVITRTVTGGLILRAGTGNQNSTYLGSIQDGSGSITFSKRGTGTLVLGGSNSYSGITFISDGGILSAQNNAALGSTAGGTTINAGTLQLAGGVNIVGEALTVNAGGDATIGAFQNLSGNNTWSGSISLATSSKFTSSSGTLTISGNIAGASSTLTLGGAGSISVTGSTTLGTGGLAKVDSGTATLAGLSYSGATTLGSFGGDNAGLLNLTGTVPSSTGAMTIYSGTLRLSGNQTLSGTLSLGGGAAGTVARLDTGNSTLRLGADAVYNAGNNPGGATIDGAVDMNALVRTFTVNDSTAATDLTINATLSGTNLVKSGIGTLALRGTNTYSGYTSITAGSLSVASDANLGAIPVSATGSSILISAGATLATTSSFTLSANRGIFLGSGSTAAAISTGAGTTLSYGGSITGGGSLAKVDTGTLVLSGSQGYTGSTNVRQGALVLNGGSLNHSSAGLTVGNLSGDNAQLSILAGGRASNSTGALGDQAGSVGTASVAGVGSAWNNSGDLFVGNSGTGSLTIQGGASVTDTIGYIGNNSLSSGTASVTGQGSTWTNSDRLLVGNSGTGALSVTAGGAVSDANGIIGDLAGSTGAVLVSGTSASGSRSTWINSANFFVGNFGTGSLRIEDGGLVQNVSGFVGTDVGGLGMVIVTGTASAWNNSSNLYVGSSGTGSLTITGSATVSVNNGSGTATLSAGSTGRGTLNIGSAAGEAASTAGRLNAAAVLGGSGSGATLQFNHLSTSANPYFFTTTGSSNDAGVAIRGSANLVQTAGYTVLTATSSFTGTTTINGGTLALAGDSTLQNTSRIRIASGTLLLGSGTGNRINNAATLELSGGAFDTNGLSETLGAVLLAGDAAIDLNDAFAGGASVLHFADSSALPWSSSVTLTITGWSGSISGGGTDQIYFGNNGSALTQAQLNQILFLNPAGYSPGTYGATLLNTGEIVVAVPEPSAGWLIVAGVWFLTLCRMRRRR